MAPRCGQLGPLLETPSPLSHYHPPPITVTKSSQLYPVTPNPTLFSCLPHLLSDILVAVDRFLHPTLVPPIHRSLAATVASQNANL